MCHPQEHLDRDGPSHCGTVCSLIQSVQQQKCMSTYSVPCSGCPGAGDTKVLEAACTLQEQRQPTWQVPHALSKDWEDAEFISLHELWKELILFSNHGAGFSYYDVLDPLLRGDSIFWPPNSDHNSVHIVKVKRALRDGPCSELSNFREQLSNVLGSLLSLEMPGACPKVLIHRSWMGPREFAFLVSSKVTCFL